MKLANLNHLAGYATQSYPQEVSQKAQTEYISEDMATGYQVLSQPSWNRGMYSSFRFTITSDHYHIGRTLT